MQNSEYQKVAEVRGGRRIWAETARHSAPGKSAGLNLQLAWQAATRELAMDFRLRE
jgi:methylmalonyl-CoA mutase N-terminal domain/subunit